MLHRPSHHCSALPELFSYPSNKPQLLRLLYIITTTQAATALSEYATTLHCRGILKARDSIQRYRHEVIQLPTIVDNIKGCWVPLAGAAHDAPRIANLMIERELPMAVLPEDFEFVYDDQVDFTETLNTMSVAPPLEHNCHSCTSQKNDPNTYRKVPASPNGISSQAHSNLDGSDGTQESGKPAPPRCRISIT